MPRDTHKYLECKIFDRTCYVTFDDIRIFDGLTGHTCGETKCFHELPENAFIVRVVWQRKKAVEVEKANGPGGIATRKSKRMKQLPA